MNELTNQKSMTIKEISVIMRCDESTIRKRIKKLFPDILINGISTKLNESQVTQLKIYMDKNSKLGHISEVKTNLEKELLIQQAMQFQQEKIITLVNEKEKLQIENKKMLPKVEFYDTITKSITWHDMGEVSKILNIKNMGRNNLYKFLFENKILMLNKKPYQKYSNYFKCSVSHYQDSQGEIRDNVKTIVNQKGIDFILKTYNRDKNNKAV